MIDRPQFDFRRPEGVETRPMGWWGTLLTAAVVLTTYAALYFTYAYVRVASQQWPPEGIAPPGLTVPTVAAAVLLASVPGVEWAARRSADGAWPAVRSGLLAVLVLGGTHLVVLLGDVTGQPFSVDEHAYGSLFYVLPSFHAILSGIGLLIAAVLLGLTWHPEGAVMTRLGTLSLRVYWHTTVLGGVLLIGVVYLLPHLWPEAISP